jgi:NTP pyrophosphatase (non-canonical NTP hydrolase)
MSDVADLFLTELAIDVAKANMDKGFWNKRQNLKECLFNRDAQLELIEALALIMTEAAEAIESVRKNLNWSEDKDHHLPHRTNLETELADIMIRCLDLAGGLNIDIGQVVWEKLEYNSTRPYLHGKTC